MEIYLHVNLLLWAVKISLYRLCVGEHMGETEEANRKMSVESLQCREAAFNMFLPQLKGENVFVCVGASPLPDHRPVQGVHYIQVMLG